MSRHGLLGALVVVIVAVAACGEDGPRAGPPTSGSLAGEPSAPAGTGASAETTSVPAEVVGPEASAPPVDDDEAAVLAAVDCYWETIVEANDPPNPDHPGFDQCFTGPALERSRGITLGYVRDGLRANDPTGATEQYGLEIAELQAERASVVECVVDDGRLIERATGTVLNDAVVSARMQIELKRVSGVWKVTDSVAWERVEGGSLCVGP